MLKLSRPSRAFCLGAASVLAIAICRGDEPKSAERKNADPTNPDSKDADSKNAEPKGKKVIDSLPSIPAKDLPPATRKKPDPAKDQYVRGAVFVQIDERIVPEKGDSITPRIKVLENNLKEYLRRSGHPIATSPEGALLRLEGTFEAKFQATLKVLGQVTAWKYSGASKLYVLDRDGKQLEAQEVPELLQENGKNEEYTQWNLERHMAKIQWDKLTTTGKTFTNGAVVSLINSLALQSDDARATTSEEVVSKLADIGLPAVPYLLEALTDNRSVRVPSSYPGLKGRSLDDLRVYHIADKALEEIFQKVSRMGIGIGAEDPESQKQRLVIIKGWENEWRRFCKPFLESSQRAAARAPAAAPSAPGAPAEKSASGKDGPSK